MNDDYVPTWPAAELDTLLKMFREGATFQAISDKLPGRSKSACIAMARRIGLSRPKPEREPRTFKPVFWNEERTGLLRKLWGENVPTTDIARKIGQTPGSILNRAKRLGLKSRGTGAAVNSVPAEELAEAIRLYQSGLTPSEIARKLKVTPGTIIGRLHRAGVTKKRQPQQRQPQPRTAAGIVELAAKRIAAQHEGFEKIEAASEAANDDAIPLIGRPVSSCAWPVGTPDRPANQLCCGQGRAGESPYCERHRAKAGTGKTQDARELTRSLRRVA